MFEKATRQKLRFQTDKGLLTVEDLWDLPLTSLRGTNLDDIARKLHSDLKNYDNVSFVVKERKSDESIQLAFDIVKHIIDVKLVERDVAQQAAVNKERKQQIMQLIANKEQSALAELPLDELRKMVEAM